jgi:SAM-dependent methyltransferase
MVVARGTVSRLTDAWRTVRRFLPPAALRLLAPAHRVIRRRHLRLMAAEDRLMAADDRSATPPAALRFKVAGPGTIPQFFAGGEAMADSVEAALGGVGRSLAAGGDLLDFGCGCGRLLAALERRFPVLRVSGCDVDAEAVEWCRRRFPGMEFRTNAEWPPCDFPPASFDLVWCGSVFTHIDERHQDAWLEEARRLLRPGGLLLASVHGRRSWEKWPPFWGRQRLARDGFFFLRSGVDAGQHPDWYQVAWHTEAYVRQHWSQWFEVRSYLDGGLNGYQDLVVAVPR